MATTLQRLLDDLTEQSGARTAAATIEDVTGAVAHLGRALTGLTDDGLTPAASARQHVVTELAAACATELEADLGFPVAAVSLEARESVVRESDIIFTVTTGSQELVYRKWLKPGAFVARLGSYQEVAYDVITEVDKVVVDRWKYVRPRIPEIIQLVEEGKFDQESIHAEWPDIVAGKAAGRESEIEVIVFIALGIWGEYAAILPEVYRRARSLGLGHELPF